MFRFIAVFAGCVGYMCEIALCLRVFRNAREKRCLVTWCSQAEQNTHRGERRSQANKNNLEAMAMGWGGYGAAGASIPPVQ